MAGLHAHGTLVATARSPQALLHQMQWKPKGTFAVRTDRIGSTKTHSLSDLARVIGAHLTKQGHVVDLTDPDEELWIWTEGPLIVAVCDVQENNRTQFEDRRVTTREHFSPVTLHPRRAASLVNLARVPGGGRIYDPFCGTGGLLLEAALMRYDTWGSDLDETMIQGSYQTLTDTPDGPLEATLFVADIGKASEMVDRVEGIVADLPYGQASTSDLEELAPLYRRAFEAFAKILPPGALAVIGSPSMELLEPVTEFGFTLREHHEEYAHKSLTRHYIVVKRDP